MYYPVYFLSLCAVLVALAVAGRRGLASLVAGFTWADGSLLAAMAALGAWLRVRASWHIDLDPYGWTFFEEALRAAQFVRQGPGPAADLGLAAHPPGFAVALGLPLAFVPDISAASFFLLALSVATIGLVWILGRTLFEDRWAAGLGAFLLAVSPVHIHTAGLELPVSLSVFWVAVFFLLLVGARRVRLPVLWGAAAVAFLLAVNIREENVLFAPFLFLTPFPWRRPRAGLLFVLAAAVLASALVLPRYLLNHAVALETVLAHDSARHALFSPLNVLWGFRESMLSGYRGVPAFVFAAGAAVAFLRRSRPAAFLLLWWGTALAAFVWDRSAFYLRLTEPMVFLPGCLLGGWIMTEGIKRFISGDSNRLAAVILLSAALATGSWVLLSGQRHYGWPDLRRDMPRVGPDAIVLVPDILSAPMALRHLFPGLRWEAVVPGSPLPEAGRAVYAFDPIPFGLEEETDAATRRWWYRQTGLTPAGPKFIRLGAPVFSP